MRYNEKRGTKEVDMTTIILAKFFAIYLIAIGISIVLNPGKFREMYHHFFKDEAHALLGGILALLFGALVVSVHNIWIMEWPLLITILGWWGVIKGMGFFACPGFIKFFRPMMEMSDNGYRIMGAMAMLFGLFFGYQGWL